MVGAILSNGQPLFGCIFVTVGRGRAQKSPRGQTSCSRKSPAVVRRGSASIHSYTATDCSVTETFNNQDRHLALQLLYLKASESMGNHDSKVVDADSVD
jgi:hypothetical protein